jgi:hypothetical protein
MKDGVAFDVDTSSWKKTDRVQDEEEEAKNRAIK